MKGETILVYKEDKFSDASILREKQDMEKAFRKGQLDVAKNVVVQLFGIFILVAVLTLVLSQFKQTNTISNDNDSKAIIDKAIQGTNDYADLMQLTFILGAIVGVLALVGIALYVVNRTG